MNLLDSAYKKATDISVCRPDAFFGDLHTACGRPMDYHVKWTRACARWAFEENVYLGSGPGSIGSTARAAVSAWLDSPGHRAKLLNRDLTHHGVMYSGPTAYARVGPDTRIWVHHMVRCL
jgi:Cysteine-rich secretory protein family